MLESILTKRLELGNYKLKVEKLFELTPEKIAQNPRSFTTDEIKKAVENISIIRDEKILNPLFFDLSDFILKDFFFKMHQTGMYNRQLKLWKAIGNVSSLSLFELESGVFKRKSSGIYIIDFHINADSTSCRAIFCGKSNFEELKKLVSMALHPNLKNSLKGIFYVVDDIPDEKFFEQLEQYTCVEDSISKYESLISGTQDVRLNVIITKKSDEKIQFEHVYPRSIKKEINE